MNKTKFFALCDKSHPSSNLRITVETAHREIYPEVALHGSWGKYDEDGEWCHTCGSITLFTPQHKKLDFREWHNVCHERAVKFHKWLEEWKENKKNGQLAKHD